MNIYDILKQIPVGLRLFMTKNTPEFPPLFLAEIVRPSQDLKRYIFLHNPLYKSVYLHVFSFS